MKLKKLIAIVNLLPLMSFAQTDLQTVLKGGELLLSGLTILKVAKSDSKSNSKVIESVCVKNKLVDKITLLFDLLPDLATFKTVRPLSKSSPPFKTV